MAVTKQSQYLLTGAEDTSIIVWDLRALTMTQRIYEHIAPVLCITSALNNSVIISGGEDSSIIITSLASGKVVGVALFVLFVCCLFCVRLSRGRRGRAAPI